MIDYIWVFSIGTPPAFSGSISELLMTYHWYITTEEYPTQIQINDKIEMISLKKIIFHQTVTKLGHKGPKIQRLAFFLLLAWIFFNKHSICHWNETHWCSCVIITWVCFLSLARSKLRLCSANHRPGYWSNLACDWPSTAWAYYEEETENGPWTEGQGPEFC